MYLPRHFEQQDHPSLVALMRTYPLACLTRVGPEHQIEADLLPLHWIDAAESGQGLLIGHVARANPLWRESAGHTVLAVFQGPESYVSPNWYESKHSQGGKVVPTWNYAMVQVRGRLRCFEDAEELRDVVRTLTNTHEAKQARPWSIDDAPADYMGSMLRGIVGLCIEVQALQGKWKVSQNRSAADREGVARALDDAGGSQDQAMAALVRAGSATPGG
jgi:transcriptional regulator